MNKKSQKYEVKQLCVTSWNSNSPLPCENCRHLFEPNPPKHSKHPKEGSTHPTLIQIRKKDLKLCLKCFPFFSTYILLETSKVMLVSMRGGVGW